MSIDNNYFIGLLKGEMILAIGCTEPTAIALAVAKARDVLGVMPEKIDLFVSKNMLKNSAGVVVPNSGGQKGVIIAAILGMLGGDSSKSLEALTSVTREDIILAKKLLDSGFCNVHISDDSAKLYVKAVVTYNESEVSVTIKDYHDNFHQIIKDGIEIIKSNKSKTDDEINVINKNLDLSIDSIYDFIVNGDLSDAREDIKRQIDLNYAIAKEGIENSYGLNVGKTILKYADKDNIWSKAKAYGAAGSDARMGGSIMPVVTICGSGNQGITASVPLVVYALENGIDTDNLIKSVALSNLIAIYIKGYIGRLSSFCGAVTASVGVAAGIAFLNGGTLADIKGAINNTIGDISGIFCDGAKSSCALKIASSIDAAFQSYYLVRDNNQICGNEGIVSGNDVEVTISNIGKIGKEAMDDTDEMICNLMVKM